MAKIKVKNRSNGKQSEFTQTRWEEIQKDPQWAGVFVAVDLPAAKPAEVKALEDKEAGRIVKPNTGNDKK